MAEINMAKKHFWCICSDRPQLCPIHNSNNTVSPVKDINWSIDANFPPVKSWTCKRGHQFRSEFPYMMSRGIDGKDVMTGPICPLCVTDFLNREFPASEVEKDG